MTALRLVLSPLLIGVVFSGCSRQATVEVAGDAKVTVLDEQLDEYSEIEAFFTRQQIQGLYEKHGIFFLLGAELGLALDDLQQSNPEAFAEIMALKRHEVEQLKKAYPYRSMSARLTYESRTGESAVVRLSPTARDHLAAMEKQLDRDWKGNNSVALRAESLRLLHAEETDKFIARDGFGLTRIRPPGPSYVPLWPEEPIPFAEAPAECSAEGMAVVPLPKDKHAARNARVRIPDETSLAEFHDQGQSDFVASYNFGHIRDRDHVAGFVPHGFNYKPIVDNIGGPNRGEPTDDEQELSLECWEITRLELVSLLKFRDPAVYVSQHLPQMNELRDAPTRPLVEFEATALQRLQAGDDLVTRATPNRIEMLGSLRALQQCRDCHEVRRGELLGAFSYELIRNPRLQSNPKVVSQAF